MVNFGPLTRGGDYRGDGGTRPPKKFLVRGTQMQASPPTIATFSEKKLDFFPETEILKCSCLYKLVYNVSVNPSDVAVNFLLQPC